MTRRSSYKGLRKHSMRMYRVDGPLGTWLIERQRKWRWVVTPKDWPRDPRGSFFEMKFSRLYMARAHAENQAGLSR